MRSNKHLLLWANIVLSFLFSIAILLTYRFTNKAGDLFSQINTSILLSFISVALLSFLYQKSRKNSFNLIQVMHILITIHLLLFIILQFSLVNIDRSRSFYVLSWADQGKIVNLESGFALKNVSSIERLNPEAINVRVAEQIEKNLLSLDGNLVRTTSSGKLAVWVAEKLSEIFKLQNWELNKN
jgi:hypothetical protein